VIALKGRKVIVTGGAGFIGSHICEELVKIGANVFSIDDYSAGKEVNTKFLEQYPNFTAIKQDVCDTQGMDEIFDGADTIFHNAASKKNICLVNPKKDLKVNAEGTLNLLEFALKHKVRKFVHASTGSVYGEPVIFPSTEEHPLRPVSYYGVSKLAGERYVDVFSHLYGMDAVILRYFHVYGPRQESNEFGGVVSIFMRNALEGKDLTIFGHGEQIRSFTYVKDLVRANIEAATNPISRGKVYNAASGIQVSIKALADFILAKMAGDKNIKVVHGEPLLGDIMHFEVANTAITKDLGIAFESDFFETLDKTIEDYLEYFKHVV
jgi:nucleoside-diphosphate-sugar epimerase